MKSVIAVVLILAVAVNGGVITATQQIHGVALHAPIVHAPAPLLVHTSSSSSYKVRAPAAKLVASAPIVHAAPAVAVGPSLPIFHAMNHHVLLH